MIFPIGRAPQPLQRFFKNTSECFVQIFYNYAWIETIKGKKIKFMIYMMQSKDLFYNTSFF